MCGKHAIFSAGYEFCSQLDFGGRTGTERGSTRPHHHARYRPSLWVAAIKNSGSWHFSKEVPHIDYWATHFMKSLVCDRVSISVTKLGKFTSCGEPKLIVIKEGLSNLKSINRPTVVLWNASVKYRAIHVCKTSTQTAKLTFQMGKEAVREMGAVGCDAPVILSWGQECEGGVSWMVSLMIDLALFWQQER